MCPWNLSRFLSGAQPQNGQKSCWPDHVNKGANVRKEKLFQNVNKSVTKQFVQTQLQCSFVADLEDT